MWIWQQFVVTCHLLSANVAMKAVRTGEQLLGFYDLFGFPKETMPWLCPLTRDLELLGVEEPSCSRNILCCSVLSSDRNVALMFHAVSLFRNSVKKSSWLSLQRTKMINETSRRIFFFFYAVNIRCTQRVTAFSYLQPLKWFDVLYWFFARGLSYI